MKTPSFGDNVRIRDVPVTRELGVAGFLGVVYGETRPSFSLVEVTGPLAEDFAINVYFKDRQASIWIATDLVEFLDHGEGAEIELEGSDKKYVRRADGGWDERPNPNPRRRS